MGRKRRTHRWASGRAFLLFLLLAAITGFSQQTPRAQEPRTGRSYETATPPAKPAHQAPQEASPVTFTDITAQSRIVFKHAASPTSQKYLLETMGSGVALFDYDNDGRLDIYFTNGAALNDPMPGARAYFG